MSDNEKLNSFGRIMCSFEGKRPDRTPVVPILREWCSVQAGIEFLEELESVEKHVYSQTYCQTQFGYDIIWGEAFACHSESEAMGSVLKISVCIFEIALEIQGIIPSNSTPILHPHAKTSAECPNLFAQSLSPQSPYAFEHNIVSWARY